jgi:hypothetical protein
MLFVVFNLLESQMESLRFGNAFDPSHDLETQLSKSAIAFKNVTTA